MTLHQGDSPRVLPRQEPGSPEPRPVPGRAGCAHGLSTQATGALEGLSLPAVTMGSRFLPIQVGWDPSLIFDFNKWVRIYFFVYVLFQLL